MRNTKIVFVIFTVVVAFLTIRSSQAEERTITEPPENIRTEWKLSTFYKKCIVTDGFPIVASEQVSDYALKEAAFLVDQMLQGRDDLRKALIKHHIRLAIMAPTELTTMMPEHSDLKPSKYWDKRARGLGATKARPAVSCAEENLLEFPGDPYHGENITIHEFSHAIHEIALAEVEPKFNGRLKVAYDSAIQKGLWKNTYAATNHAEYWAEGVQDWFHCNRTNVRDHNHVNSRAQLREYDPELAKLMEEVFRNNDWVYTFPSLRKEPLHLAGFDRTTAPKFAWPRELVEWYDKYEAEQKQKKQTQ